MSTIGYFGKKPQYPDFIKHNTGGTDILILDKLIQDGMVKAKNELKTLWKDCYKNSPAYNFIYSFTNTKNVLVGTMSSSNDKSQREFPFVTFISLNKDNLTIPPHLIPFHFSGLFNSFHLSNENFIDKENFSLQLSAVSDNSAQVNQEVTISEFQKLLDTKQNDFWERTGPDNLFKHAVVYNLLYYLPEHRSRSIPSFPRGIKITFAADSYNRELDLAFFILLILSISDTIFHLPSLFWTAHGNHLNAFFF